ncbi:hypothetical protein GCM10018782_15820 [Streptomyces griseoaurantiacus]|jgi:WhiB family redox-sensing transcriptional regulator|uniref:Transcriptional regulator WhiB n=2 Tax=Streptomyces TaxID=1883 RepID=F3NIS7_9ACTN|nr:Sporulation regulatory protein WhiD [Streptomyces griseoaurantiacus M045]GHE42305.1 hypothetical protein GCM10018782_15820 [Streptomyces griseoaurantiacus]
MGIAGITDLTALDVVRTVRTVTSTHPLRTATRGHAMADFSRLPGPNADLWDWQLLAACRGVDSSLFFHPEGERGAARSARENSAKEVCMRCPVRAECAAHALAVREPYGVWGGLTEDEREELMGRARNRLVSAAAPASSRGEDHASPPSHDGVPHSGASHSGFSHH